LHRAVVTGHDPRETAAMAASTDDFVENEEHAAAIGDLGEPPGIAGHRRDAAGGGADHGFGHESRHILRSEAQKFSNFPPRGVDVAPAGAVLEARAAFGGFRSNSIIGYSRPPLRESRSPAASGSVARPGVPAFARERGRQIVWFDFSGMRSSPCRCDPWPRARAPATLPSRLGARVAPRPPRAWLWR
jgi:hypothetical protein